MRVWVHAYAYVRVWARVSRAIGSKTQNKAKKGAAVALSKAEE